MQKKNTRKREAGPVSHEMVSECSQFKAFSTAPTSLSQPLDTNLNSHVILPIGAVQACLPVLETAFCSGCSFPLEKELMLTMETIFACHMGF